MEETPKVCCFLGHRKIPDAELIQETLYKTIEALIVYEHVSLFLFGSKSYFNSLCLAVVTKLKEKYTQIQRIYIRAEFPYINDDYKQYLLQYNDDTYYPEKILNAGRAAYVERNEEMIDRSDFCVFYYKESYAPPKRKNSRRDLFYYQPRSGTRIAYEYARQRRKRIINVAE